ncbi:kinase-like domain-containing protein, partial [Blastocladiella britannica]
MNVSPPPPPPTLRVSLAPEPHLADSAVASPVTLLRHHADGTSRLNHFLVTAVLGAGSYGTVYRATDEATGTEVAIKELSKALLRRAHWAARLARGGGLGMATATATPRTLPMEIVDPTLDAALANEMAILMQLHHPNVVRLHEAIDDAEHDAVFLVIDLCPNGPIFRLPSSNTVGPHAPPLALGTARRYFTDAVLGLEYLHHNRIAHQDIKPDNLLLTQDNRVKIADFGLSQLYNVRGDRRSSGNSSNGNHRLSGPTGGAPAFCPPEKCTMALSPFAAACTADIWSLGVVLFLMTHGRLPFHATSLLMLYRAIACDPPAIADDDPDLAHLLARMLDKNPATRISLSDIRQHPWLTQRG